jgi:hypothetical protein
MAAGLLVEPASHRNYNTRMDSSAEKTWQKNAPSQIVLDSIFAALAGVLIVFSVQDLSPGTWHKFLALLCSLFSFLLFARSAEGTTTALDEKDPRQYVYYLLWYNLGVILLVAAIGILFVTYFLKHFVSFAERRLPVLLSDYLTYAIITMLVIFSFALIKPWIVDAFWIVRAKREEFDEYLDELEDKVIPKPDPTRLFKIFYGYTKQVKQKTLPHDGVYTRLRPSNIHGVGVFAIRDIPQGTYVFSEDDEPIVWVDKRSTERTPQALKELYDDFCIIKGDKYGCPKSFDALTISWYLNDSREPSVAADKEYRFYALRDIKAGEELTADYCTYSDTP